MGIGMTPQPAYVPAPDGARLRIDAIATKLRRIQTTFSGSFVTAAASANARSEVAQIIEDAKALEGMLS